MNEWKQRGSPQRGCLYDQYDDLTWFGPMASLFTEAPQVKSISRLPSGKSRTDSLDPPNTAIVLADTSLTVLD